MTYENIASSRLGRAGSRDRADLRRRPRRGVVPGIRGEGRPLGVLPKATSPQGLDVIIRKEIERWNAIAETANIIVD
jgi:hypothetical protein